MIAMLLPAIYIGNDCGVLGVRAWCMEKVVFILINNNKYKLKKRQRKMQKPQAKQILHLRTCQVCHAEVQNELCLIDVANFSDESNNLTIVPKYACKTCRDQIFTIRSFVDQHGLCFGKDSSIGRDFLAFATPLADRRRDKGATSQLYTHIIQQQIKRQKLHHCSKMPANCLQLVYYSSLSINHAQRHERIRNIISEVMLQTPIPFQNLQDVAAIINVLMCFFSEPLVAVLMRILGERVVLDGDPWDDPKIKANKQESEKDLETDDFEVVDSIWERIYKCGYIGNFCAVLSSMLQNWSNSKTCYQKIKSHQGYLKPSELCELLPNPQPQSPSIPSPNCKECHRNRQESSLSQARFRNILSLVLSVMVKEASAQREHMVQIEAKFVREKEEFINKIIKLKDKIQVLEHSEDQDYQLVRVRSASESHHNRFKVRQLDVVSQKSEGTSKTVEANKQKNEEIIKTVQTQKPKQNDQNSLGYLQQIVCQLPDFQPTMLSSSADPQSLTESISSTIKSLNSQTQALSQKIRVLESQSKRLLSILTRKEERFVPLIHQKDEIIAKYENALWRMEHGMLVEDPALAPRIHNIIQVFKNEFMESLSNGTLDLEDRFIEDVASPVRPSPGSTTKKKNKEKPSEKDKDKNKVKEKSNKSERKAKAQEKDCVIF